MKTNKGITLIALVITIIVLVILVGVSLTMTLGENGILNQAQEAKKVTENATQDEKEEFENFDMAMTDFQPKESWDEVLKNEFGSGTTTDENGETRPLTAEEKFNQIFNLGTGIQEDPYQISSATQLAFLAKFTNEGAKTETGESLIAGKYFKLVNDLDLEYREWTAIGIGSTTSMTYAQIATVENKFTGHFDGAGYKISKIYINQPNNCAVGLFGVLDGNSIIQNVTMDSGKVIGKRFVGGIAGVSLNSQIKNCINRAEIIAQDSKDISSSGEIAGGILGAMIKGTTVIENSINYGNVTNKNDSKMSGRSKWAAGICGVAANDLPGTYSIVNCKNYGNVTSNFQQAGGIVAIASNINISDCLNEGIIRVNKFGTTSNSGCFVGGIAGDTYATSTITNCVNKGEIIAEISMAGGIAGSNSGTITECYNEGTVKQLSMIQSKYKTNAIGGIVGEHRGGTVSYCYNIGTIENTPVEGIVDCAGGIIGIYNNKSANVNYCYNTGTILNSARTGAIIGHLYAGLLNKNYYYSNTLTTGIGLTGTNYSAEPNGTDITGQAEIISQDEAKTITSVSEFKSWIESKI